MRRTMKLAGLVWCIAVQMTHGAYRIETTAGATIDATLTYALTAPELKAREWIVISPTAPNLPGQAKVTTGLSLSSGLTNESSVARRSVQLARVPANTAVLQTNLVVAVNYHAELWRRKLVKTGDGEPVDPLTLDAATRSLFLQAGKSYDLTNAAFVKWVGEARLTRKDGEGEVDFARRVFLKIKNQFTYEYRPGLDRRASAVCSARSSDCGGLSVLFGAVLRSNGIPARALVGRWAASAREGAKLGETEYKQWHVKAEFFAAGTGWVPVDLSSAVLYDKNPEGTGFFGNDRGDFLVMHIDPDLELDSIHFGTQSIPWVQGATWWVTGAGTLKGLSTKEDWVVQRTISGGR